MKKKLKYNHLKNEKSPYLQQHATNPVDWYPWSDEAFEKARKERKPIFLSIGYSTCHWCHVMARESFQNPQIGELMNEVFVNIKVDREERPDIDNIYMTACQLMTGRGGWPLTIIMNWKKEPFFAGTYFPPLSHIGGIGLKDLILNIRDLWREKPEDIIETSEKVKKALEKSIKIKAGSELNSSILDKTYHQLKNNFDPEYGGFGDFQKFPTPHHLLFLLRYWKVNKDKKSLEMVEKTLQALCQGGIYDHLGYGFHRYSVDREWKVPHFEKMLYDQALLLITFLEAYQVTKKKKYRQIAEEIIEYVSRDLTSPEGGFYSAEDADSEGEEGKFYLWTLQEIQEILEEEESKIISTIYNLTPEGNFQEEATGIKTGKNVLYKKNNLTYYADKLGYEKNLLREKIKKIKQKLFQSREKRIHPHKDDKILTNWNGLMIAGLSRASRVLEEKKYEKMAIKAVKFIIENLYPNGNLKHRYREGDTDINGQLEDYSFFTWGLLELYQTTFNPYYLDLSLELTQKLIEKFWDQNQGGFYQTSLDEEAILVRKKDSMDSALASGNSVAYMNLLQLSLLTGKRDLREKAIELERAFSNPVETLPSGHTHFLLGTFFKLGPAQEIVIVGEKDKDDTKEMIRTLQTNYYPNLLLIFKSETDPQGIESIIDYVEPKTSLEGKATAYLCEEGSCKIPTNNIQELLRLLDN